MDMEGAPLPPSVEVPVEAQPPRAPMSGKMRIAIAVGIVVIVVLSSVLAGLIVVRMNIDLGAGREPHLYPDNYTLSASYTWTFERHSYSLQLNMTAAEYYEYKDQPIARSPDSADYATMRRYVTSTDPVVVKVATMLEGMAQNRSLDNEHAMDFMLAFVQNIGYSLDNVSTGHDDYWRYSVETLWDHTGDCEDLSILYASLMEATGHDAILLVFTSASHMAVGVECPGSSGTYFSYDSISYFYCETTAPGWLVGEEPPSIVGNSAGIVQVP